MSQGTQFILQLFGAIALLLWGLTMLREAVSKGLRWRLKRITASGRCGRRGRSESVESRSMHLDLVRDLKRVNDHIAEIADSRLIRPSLSI